MANDFANNRSGNRFVSERTTEKWLSRIFTGSHLHRLIKNSEPPATDVVYVKSRI
jgi:hypothetical protein